jgi:hypothetical protein
MTSRDHQDEPDQPADEPRSSDQAEPPRADAASPLDETVRVQDGDATPASGARELPVSAMETVQATDAFTDDARASGETTIIPEPLATVMVQAESAPGEQARDSDDLDATATNLDSTTPLETDAVAGSSASVAEPNADPVLPGQGTVGNVDQTVAIQLPRAVSQAPTVRSGIQSSGSKPGAKPAVSTVLAPQGDALIMASSAISQTVNPRDLSDRDAAAWNAVVGQGSEPMVLSPAINRTFSDKQFDRLRQCHVTALKSDADKAADYRLVRKLGQGGMGDVYVARQGSLDRLLALKLIRPLAGAKREQLIKAGRLEAVEEERRQQFLSEAIVTGDLDHPNIVPIHDVALTSSNELFYSMKRVIGTPWSDVIGEKSRDENLEILLKAADAIGFAHTRGVVHRDIKPENIMLGDFGVVLVMDWGLALPTSQFEKQDSIFATSGLGGTPAFMAPEMATGPLQKIGPASDIYLLGATLYMIVTGYAPHHAGNVTECLKAVRSNRIREVPEEQRGELLDIAHKAMATDPQDRYPDVASFQKAIRDYRAHAESISLSTRAADDLQRGIEHRSYGDFSRAAFRFEEAIKLWDGNEKAHLGLAETRLAHAHAACENGDFDLGLTLIDREDPEHQLIEQRLRHGLHERESRASRLALMRKVAAAMLAFIIIGGAVSLWKIDAERQIAKTNEQEALKQKELADQQTLLAETNAQEALRQEALALEQKGIAEQNAEEARISAQEAKRQAGIAHQQRQIAEQNAEEARNQEAIAWRNEAEAQAQRKLAEAADAKSRRDAARAEYEEYASKIALAKARLDRNEADGARKALLEIRSKAGNNWEWRWLWQQANQSESSQPSRAAVIDQALGQAGRTGLVALSNGQFAWLALDPQGQLPAAALAPQSLPSGARALAVAISPDRQWAAIGTASGDIYLAPLGSADFGPPLTGHERSISDMQFTADGLLVSGSLDKTVRVWDPNSRSELTRQQACWHISPVRQLAVAGTAAGLTVAVAIADDASGAVAIWHLRRSDKRMSVEQRGTLLDHSAPVSCVAISSDGKLAASGDLAGNVLLWEPQQVTSIDYSQSIKDAVARLTGEPVARARTDAVARATPTRRLVDESPEARRQFVSTLGATAPPPQAHQDAVKVLRFSRDAALLLSGSDDYTLKLWDVPSQRVTTTLKGHGGWVVGADFFAGGSDVIVSSSNDATVRSWRPSNYVGAFVRHRLGSEGTPQRQAEAHESEILAASFSADGRKVVTASRDHTARVLEIDPANLSFVEVTQLQDSVLDEGTSFVAMSLQVDRPHNRLYIGSADSTVRVWDLERGTQIGEATGTGLNAGLAVSRDGRWMLTGSSSADAKAKLWQLDPLGTAPPRLVHRLSEHRDAVTAFAISPDSKRLFSGDRNGIGAFWDASTGRLLGLVGEFAGFRINAASFTADGRYLLVGSDDEQLTVIDVASGKIVRRMDHDGYVTQLAVSPDQRHVLTVSERGDEAGFATTAILWDWTTGLGRLLDAIVSPRAAGDASDRRLAPRITSARFDETGRTAVVSRLQGAEQLASIGIWNVAEVAAEAPAMNPSPTAAGSDRARAAQSYSLPAILGTAEVVLPLDGRVLLTMNRNAAFQWDLDSGQLIKSYRAHAELTEACFSPDGKYVATSSRSIKIWDASTGRAITKIESSRPIRSVQFAPGEPESHTYLLAAGGEDGTVRIWSWNAETRQERLLHQLRSDAAGVDQGPIIRRLRFSPQADQLLVVGDSGLAELWDLRGEPRLSASFAVDATSDLGCAAFSADGKYAAAGGRDRLVRIWELGKPGAVPIVLSGHGETVNDVVFLGSTEQDSSAGSLRVMTASSDDTAKVWDPRIGASDEEGQHPGSREIVTLERHQGDVTAVDVNGDGKLLMTAGKDGAVILWPAEPAPNLFEELH